MASVNSLKVNSPKGRSTRDMSFDHVSTIDFNVVKPMGIFELIPGDRIKINPEVWLRTQAMNVPTFGKMDVITRAFFVPLRLCWKQFNNFYRQAPVKSGSILTNFSEVPHVSMHDLSNEFLRRFEVFSSESSFINWNRKITNMEGIATRLHFGAMLQSSSVGSTPIDFTTRSASSLFQYKFNPIGKRVFDFFNSLGYRFQFFYPNFQSSTNKGTEDNYYDVSVLPLVGWLKMFQDWYCPAEFKYLFSEDILENSGNTLSLDTLKDLLDQITWAVFIYFNDDIFSMCENQPFYKGNSVTLFDALNMSQIDGNPNDLLSRNLEWHHNTIVPDMQLGARINNFDTSSTSGSTPRNYVTIEGKKFAGSVDTSQSGSQLYATGIADYGSLATDFNNQISNWSVMAVMKTAQWLQRNNLLSSRVTEYLKSKFGVTPSSARLDITEYVGHAGAPVKISDIAGTDSNNLADLGAKGTSYSIDKLSYSAEEFGYLYFTVELRPRIGYGQGVDPLVLRTHLHEFYNEEFDSLGFEPVPTECLVAGPLTYNNIGLDETMNDGSTENRIFGYLPRLWSYKCKHDNLSGDFILPTQAYDGDLASYHLMRTVKGPDLDDFVHNTLSFRYAGLSVMENNFGRIFRAGGYNEQGIFDHFMLICSFEAFINGLPLAMNESWQVNANHDEREGHLTNIQASL